MPERASPAAGSAPLLGDGKGEGGERGWAARPAEPPGEILYLLPLAITGIAAEK